MGRGRGGPGRALPGGANGEGWGLVVAGQRLHVYAVRVARDAGGNQVPVNVAFGRELEFVQEQAQEPVHTVRLPGLSGDWVVMDKPGG